MFFKLVTIIVLVNIARMLQFIIDNKAESLSVLSMSFASYVIIKITAWLHYAAFLQFYQLFYLAYRAKM